MMAQIREALEISQQAGEHHSSQVRPHREEAGSPHQVDEPEAKHGHECVMDPTVINLVQENQLAERFGVKATQTELERIANPISNLVQEAQPRLWSLARSWGCRPQVSGARRA